MKKKLKNSKEESSVKNTIKSNRGITLIALVITIIVLLILAGVTIAMLSGENGILSRATETRSTNAEAQADEQAKLAYMGVKTDIIAERVSNAIYNASTAENTEALGQKVKRDLDPKNTNTPWNVDYGTAGTITMTFTDSSLNNTKNTTNNHQIIYTIELPGAGGTEITLKRDGDLMSSGGSGGSEQEEQTTSTVVFPNGQDIGQDVTIGEERFKIIKKSTDGKTITAMPYYNLYIAGNPETIKQATEANAGTGVGNAGTIAFSKSNYWTTAGINIPMDEKEETKRNNAQDYIERYEAYLKGLGANNVVATIGRCYKNAEDSEKSDTEVPYYIQGLSGLNPKGVGNFWLGSSRSIDVYDVLFVSTSGYINYGIYYGAYLYGVRPVIIITIS